MAKIAWEASVSLNNPDGTVQHGNYTDKWTENEGKDFMEKLEACGYNKVETADGFDLTRLEQYDVIAKFQFKRV